MRIKTENNENDNSWTSMFNVETFVFYYNILDSKIKTFNLG